MKTAVSIPDDVFRDADRIAKREKKSRSQVYSDALREYVARHAPDEITEAMNRVVDAATPAPDPFTSEAARRILEQTEW
jgi:metal-responsive CopG/Arc/MetJ family transcriptional regulator